jgi:hypothetical protein
VIPDGQEQAEVDVAGGAVTHVVEAVQRRQAITRPSTPGRMSTLECCNSSWMAMANASTAATGIGRPSSSSGSTPPRFGRLVQRVFHQAVEAVHAGDAVMHRMQPPQPADAMAGVVHQGDAEIGADDGQQHLQREWPLHRPGLPRNDAASNGTAAIDSRFRLSLTSACRVSRRLSPWSWLNAGS